MNPNLLEAIFLDENSTNNQMNPNLLEAIFLDENSANKMNPNLLEAIFLDENSTNNQMNPNLLEAIFLDENSANKMNPNLLEAIFLDENSANKMNTNLQQSSKNDEFRFYLLSEIKKKFKNKIGNLTEMAYVKDRDHSTGFYKIRLSNHKKYFQLCEFFRSIFPNKKIWIQITPIYGFQTAVSEKNMDMTKI